MTDMPTPEPALRSVIAHINTLIEDLISPLGISRAELWGILRSFGLALAGGLAFVYLRLPLPWMLGPLAVSLVCSTAGRPLKQPKFLLLPMRALLGVAIGASFTPELWGRAGGVITSLALLLPYMLLVTFAGVLFFERVARFDRPTAFFCSGPGGLADMIIMSADAGASVRHVTLIQAARVLTIVSIVPFWLQYVDKHPLGVANIAALHLNELLLVDALAILAIAYGGWFIATRAGLIGGSMIGPLVLSMLLHGAGVTTVKVPIEILVIAQLTIGIMIGGHFVGVTLREFVTILSWGITAALVMVLTASAVSLAISKATGIDSTTLLLSYAPGGQNEMSIMALILHLDVAIVALHHLLRVAMVVIGAQFVLKANRSWRSEKT
jgi:membrane AbrB-like protein